MTAILADTLCAAAALFPLLHFETTEIRLDTLHEDDAAVVIHFPFTVQAAALPPETTAAGEQASRTITLADLWTSCPCTRLHSYPEAPLDIGDSGEISVRFHPAGQSGEILRTISVYCKEQPETPLEELFITAHVLPPNDPFYHYPLRYDPLRLMQDRVSIRPSHPRATLLLANVHQTDTLLIGLEELPEGITAPTQEAPIRLSPGSAGSLPLSLSKAADSLSVPQVKSLSLRWQLPGPAPEPGDHAAGKLTIELLIEPE